MIQHRESEQANGKYCGNGISIKGLSKSYKNFAAVNSLSLEVNPGDIFGFLGPNGAGKTTTIRILCGLLIPSAGRAWVSGFDIVRQSLQIRSIIGLLPESAGFYNWMNAREYLLHFANLYRIDEISAKSKVTVLLELVGLAEKAHAPISYYSRGMRQRLGLAHTLINDPQVLFLDEPTLGLDPRGQIDIQRILLDLNRERGVTIFLSSHALEEVSSLCNRVAILDHGSMIAQGTIDELRSVAGDAKRIAVTVLKRADLEKDLSKLPFQWQFAGESTSTSASFAVVEIDDSSKHLGKVALDFESRGIAIHDIRRQQMGLEEVFFKLLEGKDGDNPRLAETIRSKATRGST